MKKNAFCLKKIRSEMAVIWSKNCCTYCRGSSNNNYNLKNNRYLHVMRWLAYFGVIHNMWGLTKSILFASTQYCDEDEFKTIINSTQLTVNGNFFFSCACMYISLSLLHPVVTWVSDSALFHVFIGIYHKWEIFLSKLSFQCSLSLSSISAIPFFLLKYHMRKYISAVAMCFIYQSMSLVYVGPQC